MELTATTPSHEAGDENEKRQGGKISRFLKHPVLLAFLFFVFTSAVFTWPLVTDLGGSLFDRSDATDTTWRLGSIAYQLLHDPFHLYNSNTFYPLQQNLQFDELVVGNGLLFAPVVWLTANPVLAYNLLVLSSFALSGFAMWLVVRHLTGSAGAGLVAGLIYAYSPWHQAQFAHAGLGAQEWMVFALYFLILFTEHPKTLSKRALLYLGLFVLFFVLQILCAGYYAYFITILCGFYLLYYFLKRFTIYDLRFTIKKFRVGRTQSRAKSARTDAEFDNQSLVKPAPIISEVDEQSWTQPAPINPTPNSQPLTPNPYLQLGLLALAGVLALLILLPFIQPYMQAQQEYGFKRDIAETRYWSAAPPSLLRTVPRSWLYKPVERGIFKAQSSGERVMYPGLIALGLALLGLFAGRKAARGGRWTFGLLALVALLLSFGPYFNVDEFGDRFQPQKLDIQLPYLWLYNTVPGFDSLRVPHRFAQLFMLALAVCAGYGVARLQSSKFKVQGSKFKKQGFAGDNPELETVNTTFKIVNRGLAPFGGKPKIVNWLVPTIFGLLVGIEFFAPGLPQVPTPMGEQAPAMYRWLAGETGVAQVPKDALVLELPMTGTPVPVNVNPDYALYGLLHLRPMLNGTANILPPGFERMYNEVSGFPDARSLDVAESLEVKFLLVHRANPALNAASQETLAKLAAPGGRLEVVKEFGSDVIYRLKPGGRLAKPAELIPSGAEVLLADDTNHKNLYTTAVARLLGPDRRYFSPYHTIYNSQIQPVQPNKVYGYAVLYKNTSPATYGYSPSDLIWENEVVQIYRKRPGQ